MSGPKRVQQRRTKGWRKPEGAVAVGRGTKWGTPYRVVAVGKSGPFDVVLGTWFCAQSTGIETARRIAVDKFRNGIEKGWGDFPWPSEIRAELAGKDLMCWCPLDQPCHADVLLELAHGGEG